MVDVFSSDAAAAPLTGHDGDRQARRCAVLGSPISHSLSPAMHRAGFATGGDGGMHRR